MEAWDSMSGITLFFTERISPESSTLQVCLESFKHTF